MSLGRLVCPDTAVPRTARAGGSAAVPDVLALRTCLALHCTPEHNVVPQPCDLARAQLADYALTKPLPLLVAERVDGGAVARSEHDLPEVVRPFKFVVLARGGLDRRVCDTAAREQVGQRGRRGDLVPWGLNALNSVGSSSRTEPQKRLDAGSDQSGPEVVIARVPPGRTSRHISATNAGMSAAKNTPKTHTTALKEPLRSPDAVASHSRKETLVRPRFAARCLASVASITNGWARSRPSTFPAGPTARAAGARTPPRRTHV